MQKADGARRNRGDNMPKLPVSDEEIMNRHVKAAIQDWQIIHNMSNAAVAKRFNVTEQTVWGWKKHPERMFSKARRIIRFFKFSDEQILNMLRPPKERR